MKIKKVHLAISSLVTVSLFSAILFGLTGLRTFLGLIIIVFLPTYLIMKCIDIAEYERIFFSAFISLLFFPLLVWYVDRIIPSLRVSIAVTFVLLMIIGLLINSKNKRNKKV